MVMESLPEGDQVSMTEYEDGHLIQIAVIRGGRALGQLMYRHICGWPVLDMYSPPDLNDPFLYISFWRSKP